jgi:SAM-dependent methyltransferase
MLNSLLQKSKQILMGWESKDFTTQEFWRRRAKRYGKRAVLNLAHSNTEFEVVTNLQKEKIFPYLSQALRGNERFILDFGCGPGRFTLALAEIAQAKVIGIDPIPEFIKIAPTSKDVEYRLMKEDNKIPLLNSSVDVVWICLVLGGLSGSALDKIVLEIKRVLKPDGLLFLVENTSSKPDAEHWKFRSITDYQTLFSEFSLQHLNDYVDLDEQISIMAARRFEC